jgi:hypothetical protein
MSVNWSELNLSEDTKKMLEDLIERKKKWERRKKVRFFCFALTTGLCYFFAYTFYLNIMLGSGGNVMAMLDMIFSYRQVTFSFLASILSIMVARNEVNKAEKAKKKYENLREEAIDKLDSSWLRNVKSETREQVSKFMKVQYDINLVYKS